MYIRMYTFIIYIEFKRKIYYRNSGKFITIQISLARVSRISKKESFRALTWSTCSKYSVVLLAAIGEVFNVMVEKYRSSGEEEQGACKIYSIILESRGNV